MSNETITIWVCVDCMLHHANGECGGCHDDLIGHDKEPLALVDDTKTTMGMMWSEHDCLKNSDEYWEHDGDLECDCEVNTFSFSQCEGCGSWLHGERHAMTLWV